MPITIEYPTAIYTLLTSSRGDLPAILVVNEALVDFAHREIFCWHLSVEITAKALGDNGMPTTDECGVLDDVGDEIDDAVLDDRNALFLARITNDGKRELLYRVHDPKHANALPEKLIARPDQKREWSYRMVGDGEWELAEPLLRPLVEARTN